MSAPRHGRAQCRTACTELWHALYLCAPASTLAHGEKQGASRHWRGRVQRDGGHYGFSLAGVGADCALSWRDLRLGSKARPPLGAHVVSRRRGYLHHGIYVGQGKVVHYAGLARGLRRRPVEEISLTRFAAGRPLWMRCGPSAHFDREEVIRRARSRVGEDCYRLWTNNCEHFCEWCLRGEPRSYQIERMFWLPQRVLRVLGKHMREVTQTALRFLPIAKAPGTSPDP